MNDILHNVVGGGPVDRFRVFASLLILLTATLGICAQEQPSASTRLITHPEPVRVLPGANKRWALVIGVDKYEDSNISPLRGSSNDANSLKDALVKHAGFPDDQVIVLSSNEPSERQPTRKNILKRLSNLSGLVPKDGLLLLSFAGHGIDRSGRAFLIPSDATLTEDLGLLEETAISVNRVKQRIKDTGVQQVIILLDACRAYPTGRSNSINPLTPAFTNGLNFDVPNREVNAFAVLYATSVGSRAYEYGEKNRGYFSWAITQALGGAAANERGEVTLRSLVKYLEDTVPKLVAIEYGARVVQTPFTNIEGYRADELILAYGSSTPQPKLAEQSANVVGPNVSETALWDSIKHSTSPQDFQKYLDKYPNGEFAKVARDRRARAISASASKSSGSDKGGQIVLSYLLWRPEGQRSFDYPNVDGFITPLIDALKRANLSVTMERSLTEKERSRIGGAVRGTKQGGKTQARSTRFAVNLDVSIVVRDLAPYGGLEIAVANITLRAINLENGELAAVENIEGKGFGLDPSTARSNAIKEAGRQLSRGFVDKVAETCAKQAHSPR